MAKSLRCKREKRLRALRREIVQPFYDAKETAKLAAQEAALNAPKLPILSLTVNNTKADMDVEMDDGTTASAQKLKATGGVGKKGKGKFKLKKSKRRGKGKISRKNKI